MNEPISFHPLTKESIRHQELAIEWRAPEYHHTERSNDWYWIVGIIAGALAAAAVLFGNSLLALIVIIATAIMMMYAARPPEQITIGISARGIRVNNRLYPFNNIKSFSIKDHWSGQVLMLQINKTIAPIVVLAIDDQIINLSELHQYLEAFIPEADLEIPLAELLAERLGF